MLLQDIRILLERSGYGRVATNGPEIFLYQKQMEVSKQFILLVDPVNQLAGDASQLSNILDQVRQKLLLQEENCSILNLVLTGSENPYRFLLEKGHRIWFIDQEQYRLVLYEDQAVKEPWLKEALETILEAYQVNVLGRTKGTGWVEEPLNHENGWNGNHQRKSLKEWIRSQPVCCLSIVAVNVLIFVILMLTMNYHQYDSLVDQLGLYWPAVFYDGQIYRVITAMFLHSGIDHLFNNMLVLYFVGEILERTIGWKKYLGIYFLSGILSGLVSMGYHWSQGKLTVSIGASGAIFGVIGAVVMIMLLNRSRVRGLGSRRIILFVFFSLYGGFMAENIDNAAHIGGFLAGFLLAGILSLRKRPYLRSENK